MAALGLSTLRPMSPHGRLRRRWLAALCALLVTACALALRPPAHAAGPLKILFEGDSITQGFNGDFTWRHRLWDEFQRQQTPVDFVGSRHLPDLYPGYVTTQYADPNFDQDHAAAVGAPLQWLADRVRNEVASSQPDLVVLEAGTNDFRHQETVDEAIGHLRDWFAEVRAAKPDVRIMVSSVLPVQRSDMPWMSQQILDYDARLPEVLADLSTDESPVSQIDIAEGYTPTPQFTYDGIHPTATGESLIAQNVADALYAKHVLPEKPTIYRGFQPWYRNLQPIVRVRSDHRAFVTWDHQSLTGARIVWRQRPAAYHELPRTLRWSFLSGVLRPGATYDIRLRGVRYAYASAVGPAVTITIPRHRRS